MLKKVISGGQTGADRGGVIAAKACGIQTGGCMPHGFKAQDGYHPEFAELYGMYEHPSGAYPPRTEENVINSNGTIRIATDFSSPGEVLTLKFIKKHYKEHLPIDPFTTTPEEVVYWLLSNKIEILNVAGNSEKTSPHIQEFTTMYLTDIFKRVQHEASATATK